MGRPEKLTVDYFSHDCIPKKTLFIVEQKYKNNGYAFWYKLLELLGSTKGHFFDLNDKGNMEFLAAKTHLSNTECTEILNLLSDLEAIDEELWQNKVVWCQNFVDRLDSVYSKRENERPQKPDIKNGVNGKIRKTKG
jgi:hypothetical protein